jgi:hypothetical protein
MTKQFTLKQAFAQTSHIDRDERFVCAIARSVQSPSNYPFARSVFAGN